MSWRCPACRSEVPHSRLDSHPDPTSDYRCPACRLDLRFDSVEGKMTVAPLDTEVHAGPARPRTLPTPWVPRPKSSRRTYHK